MSNFIDLAKTAGFNVKLNIDKKILFVGTEAFSPTIRRIKDMTEVMIDRPLINNEADMNKELYYMGTIGMLRTVLMLYYCDPMMLQYHGCVILAYYSWYSLLVLSHS